MRDIDIKSLVVKLLPHGRFEHNEYVALNPTRADNNLGSFRINVQTGKWSDFATGDKGKGSISLYAYARCISYKEACYELLGKYDYRTTYTKPIPKSEDKKDVSLYIKKILDGSSGYRLSPVEKYLNNRGITALIPNNDILYHPKLYHTPTKTTHPAMIGLVKVYPYNEVVGLHRTYLTHDGYKADIEPNKMMLGNVHSGAIRIGDVRDKLVITEGIETALSIYQVKGYTVWASLSSTNMRNIVIPSGTPEIIIACDNDIAGRASSGILGQRLLREGYIVYVSTPKEYNDYNDVLLAKGN